MESQVVVEDNLAFKKGDRVYVQKKEPRVDDEETYQKLVGEVTQAFNAWHPETGDHWQYKIKGPKGEYMTFYEGVDAGSIILVSDD